MVYSVLYNLFLLLGVVLLAPLWGVWMLMVPKVRAGFRQKLGLLPASFQEKLRNTPLENRIWIHSVSVGELNAARPLIKRLQEKGFPLIISTTTATGNQLAHKTHPDIPILYFPYDLPGVVGSVLNQLQPALIVILETEIWPNLLWKSAQRQIPILMVNGRLSQKSYNGYARLSWFFSRVLNCYTALMMQSPADAKRMMGLGVAESKVHALGNIKFDMPPVIKTQKDEALVELFQFPAMSPVIVFASTHKGEEELFIKVFDDLLLDFPDLRAVIAPRHPERTKWIATMLMGHGTHFALRSQLTEANPNRPDNHVIVLDTIGELNAVFGMGTIACMGGTFVEWGGHNPLEPINAQIPVIFGPSMENFHDIVQRVLEARAGFQAVNIREAEQHIRELLTRPEFYLHIVRNGQRLIAENRGVTEILAQRIEEYLQPGVDTAALELPAQ